MLTHRQAETLTFIEAYSVDHAGAAPTLAEIAEHLDLSSKSGIHRLLKGLEERGFIRRMPNRARAIEVIRHAGTHA